MSRTRIYALLLSLVLVGGYGYRAWVGWPAGWAWARAKYAIIQRDYEDAIPDFERAAIGYRRFAAQRRTGDARIDVWELEARRGGPMGADVSMLEATALDYMQALCSAPAARNPWEGLGLVYQKLEWMGREQRSETDWVPGADPWSRVGRAGRIALGMMRLGTEAAPNWYLHYDWLARMFWMDGLEDETREALSQSAVALPLYFPHEFAKKTILPDWSRDVFFEASRAQLGRTPMLTPALHLVDLGKLAIRRGAYDDAYEVLAEGLEFRGNALNRAEIRFQLGLALIGLGRDAEGREQLLESAEHPAFRTAAVMNLAWAAERQGDYPAALKYLRELRRQDPRNVDHCLRSAFLATQIADWEVALEALEWAKLISPEDPRPYLAMIETYMRMDDPRSARDVLREIDVWGAELVPDGLRRRLLPDGS